LRVKPGFREIRVRRFQPVEDQPEVALQHRPLERVVDEFLAFGLEKLFKHGQCRVVSGTVQQVLGLRPEQRFETVVSIGLAVGTEPDEQRFVQAVPKVSGVRVIDRTTRRRIVGRKGGPGSDKAGDGRRACDEARAEVTRMDYRAHRILSTYPLL